MLADFALATELTPGGVGPNYSTALNATAKTFAVLYWPGIPVVEF